MRWQVIKIRVFRWIRNVVLYGIYLSIVFILASFLLLQIPAVQKTLIERYTGDLKKVIGFNVTFSSINLKWYDRLEIQNLLVEDPEHNAMIYVGDLKVNFRIASLWDKNEINIDGAAVDSASVNLKTIQETDSTRDLNINVFVDRINNMSSGGGGASSTKVNIGEIVLDRSGFIYNQVDSDSIKEGFDYKHFRLSLNDGELTSFKVIGDTIQFQLNSLTAVDAATKLDVKSLQTFFRISQTTMEFLGVHANAGKSVISDTIIFSFNSQRDFNDFNNKISFRALLKNTYLHPDDLELFAPGAKAIGKPVTLSGRLTGRVNRLHYTKMDVRFGNTSLTGSLDLDGLPSLNETFIRLKLNKSKVDIDDIHFAFDDFVYDRLKPLGTVNMLGTFTGFTNDFVADATLDGRLGWIRSNINLKVNQQNLDKTLYKGGLELKDFQMGKYFNDTTLFQNVTLRGNVVGRGLTYESADFKLVGTINSVGIAGYNYVNITTNAQFARQFFNGALRIDDPNLRFNAEGSIDFRSKRDIVQLQATLDTALIHKLGFSKKELAISSYVDINSRGLQIDSLFGDALFKNTKIHYNDKFIELDSIHLISEMENLERQLTFRSSLFDASMKGNYYYSTLFSDFTRLFQELLLSLRNDKSAIAAYYNSKRKSTQEYEARIEVNLHNINPLTTLAGIDLQMSRGTKIEGRFTNGLTSILQAFSTIDTITYEGKNFLNNDIEFTGSKIRDSANVLAMATIRSDRQLLSKALTTKNLLVEGIWNRDHVDLGLDADQEGFGNQVRLRTEVDFLDDSTKIKVLPSKVIALDREWVVDQTNYILFQGKEFTINHLRIHNDDQSILIDGLISEDPEKELTMTVSNLNLDIINNFSTEKFGGILNAKLIGRDIHKKQFIQNDLNIDSLTVNDFLIGDVEGKNEWNPEKQKFDISFSIDRLNEITLTLNGIYDPSVETDPLDVKATFNNTRLKMLEPVLRGLFSEIDGELTGVYNIRGNFFNPTLSGEGKVKGGKIMIDYLHTLYSFNGTLGMSPSQIIFDNIEVIDAIQNRGTLHGYIAHKNFNKFVLNLDGEFVNFQVLNTTSKDNDLFYGQGYATGNLNIFGPSSNLKISANARTEKNTKIYIPISGASETDKKDFITFAHFTDSLSIPGEQKKVVKKRELSGITVDINLDITPAAYAEIIFDIKAGDIIRGRGNGDIRLQLDTKGEFNMFGGIQFTEGAYNFTLYDIINKEFNIKPGSSLLWYGDPYQGIMNITASYRQLASLATIYDKETDIQSDPAIKRKYPIEVQLKLDGPMLSPAFQFDLVAPDLPTSITLNNGTQKRLSFDFAAFKTRLDEQELKRQVFSLIILRKLSPLDAFNTSGSLANSVSELLSNQLSYWLTQMDQNLEIDLDLGALDTEAFNTFQLRLSYSFLNGRLRVTRDGALYTQNPQQQQSVAALAGDWIVDYLLTPDGKFRVKMYSRSNFNAISSSLGAQTAVTTGFSLMYTQSFNEVRDLLKGARDRRRKELELEEEVNELDSVESTTPKSGNN